MAAYREKYFKLSAFKIHQRFYFHFVNLLRINELQELLKEDNIDFKLFRKQCFRGITLSVTCLKKLLAITDVWQVSQMTVVYDLYAGNSYSITFHLTVNSGKKSYEARENSTNSL